MSDPKWTDRTPEDRERILRAPIIINIFGSTTRSGAGQWSHGKKPRLDQIDGTEWFEISQSSQ